MKHVLCVAIAVLAAAVPLLAVADEIVIESADDAFDELRRIADPDYGGDSVEDAIAQFYREGEVDEGTYPASEMWERDFDLTPTDPERLGYSGRMFFRFSNDDISGVEKWEHEYELSLQYGSWDSYLRWSDFNAFPNRDDPFRWDKGRVRYRGDGFKATAGSLGALFGRGLALNLYEDQVLEHDNEIEGVKAEVEVGEGDLTVLWGTRKPRSEPQHSTVTGARISAPLTDDVEVGLHAVQVEFPALGATVESPDMLDYDLVGGDIQVRSGPFKLYAETVGLQRDAVEYGNPAWDFEGRNGTGHYVNVGLTGDGYAFTGEYKDYQGIGQPFTILPPVRHWSEAASADPYDDVGYGGGLFWDALGDGSLFDLHYAQDNAKDGDRAYTECSVIYTSPAVERITWVGEYWYVLELGQKHDIQRLSLSRPLDEAWTASTFLEREEIDPGFIPPWEDWIVEGELTFQSIFNVAYTWETTNEPDVESNHWGIWEFKYRPDENQELALAVGSRREGLVCSGGICRLEPEFDGVKADYLVRF